MSLSLSFLGAAGSVTGSRFLLDDGAHRVIVDCGLFQGVKSLRDRNWARFPVEPASINAALVTHAHLDHTGYLPALIRDGFAGRIHCSSSTQDLCGLLLPDSGHLQEQDAEFANRHGYSKHKPALPLYTLADAERSLTRFTPIPFHERRELPAGPAVTLRRAGHIMGASTIQCEWGGTTIVFSGDIGRYNDPILPDPEPVPAADCLLVESTYGDRRHDTRDAEALLGDIVTKTVGRGGTVIIPAFAVGRAQLLLYHLHRLAMNGRLANVTVYLDSPMAVNASELQCRHLDDIRLTADQCAEIARFVHYARTVDESKAAMNNPLPKVIISASGMATGGRVLHHLKRYAPDPRSTIIFAGYQAAGTRGQAMLAGAENIKIHGDYVPVRAEIQNLAMLSAHADSEEILKWLRGFQKPPRMTFITHGEPASADALRLHIKDELGWPVRVPEYLEKVELT